MNRTLLYGSVLASAVAGAVIWAGSLSVQGRFCFGLDEPPDAGRPEPARKQVEPVDPARVWREPGPSRPADDTFQADPVGAAPQAATPARVAIEAAAPQPQVAGLTDLGEPVSPESPADGVAEQPESRLPEGWTELAQAALAEPDAELRGEAMPSVSVHRGPEAVAVLTEVAAGDPDTDNRLRALQSLWYAAADGLDQEGEIKRVLEDARANPDPDIGELAEKAVADLERLAARRANGG